MHRDWDVSQNEEAVDRWQCFLFSSCSGKDGFNHFLLIYRIMRSNMKDKEKLSELLKLMMQFRKKRKKPLFPVPNGLRIVHIPEFCRGTHIQLFEHPQECGQTGEAALQCNIQHWQVRIQQQGLGVVDTLLIQIFVK